MFAKITTKIAQWCLKHLLAQDLITLGDSLRDDSPCHNDEPIKTTVFIEAVRLRPDVLEKLERECAQPYVSPTTTELMAGYQLGIQAVLKKLRDGYASN